MKSRVADLDASDVRQRLQTIDPEDVRSQLQRIDPGFLSRGAGDVETGDADRVVRQSGDIEASFERTGLGRLLDDGQLLLQLVRDARGGAYRELPRWTLSAVVFTLLYVLNPLDLIPDVIPGVGALDDAAVVSVCLLMIEQDLLAYRQWRQGQLPSGSSANASRDAESDGRAGALTDGKEAA